MQPLKFIMKMVSAHSIARNLLPFITLFLLRLKCFLVKYLGNRVHTVGPACPVFQKTFSMPCTKTTF